MHLTSLPSPALAHPTKLLREMTGYSKTKSTRHEMIRNYQVSHVFGRTKNVFAFTAPWNIVYVPKMLDPFTGHEAKGEMISEFTRLFQQRTYKNFEPLIEDYNNIVTGNDFRNSVSDAIEMMADSERYDHSSLEAFKKSFETEYQPIILSDS